jgi:hypothetical protein
MRVNKGAFSCRVQDARNANRDVLDVISLLLGRGPDGRRSIFQLFLKIQYHNPIHDIADNLRRCHEAF